MISYFYRNKGRSQLKTCEDSLTAVVFDYLKYLPTPMFWELLKSSLYQDKLPSHSGELLDIVFWDKWSADHEEINNKSFVEPDVLLRFKDFDVIVEAKRYNKNQQSYSQLKNEIISYYNDFEEDNKKLYFVKLGGLFNFLNDEDFKYKEHNVIICKTDWTRLLDSITLLHDQLKKGNRIMVESYIRILEDCIHGFALHQFYKKEWMSDLDSKTNINQEALRNLFIYE